MNIFKNIINGFKGGRKFVTDNLTTKNKPLSISIALILLGIVTLSNPLMVFAIFVFCVMLFALMKKW